MGLANLLATPEDIKTNTDDKNLQTVQQQDQFEEQDAQSTGTVEIVSSLSQDVQSAYKSIISVTVKADDSKWLANNTLCPLGLHLDHCCCQTHMKVSLEQLLR